APAPVPREAESGRLRQVQSLTVMRAIRLATAMMLTMCFAPLAQARAATPAALDVRAADSLASHHPGSNERKALERWTQNASLLDLVWVLRRNPTELGDAGPTIAGAAYRKASADRVALRQRLWARLDEESRKNLTKRGRVA